MRATTIPGTVVTDDTIALASYFADLQDPRVERTRRHELLDIIVLAILGVIGNSNTWEEIAIFAHEHQAWLQAFLRLPNGTPSKDTFRRVFAALDPDAFLRGFQNWMQAFARAHGFKIATTQRRHYALDGKTYRRSGGPDRTALHTVSVWAAENHLVLGQVATDTKSNEITAIPELLQLLALKGAVVTLDALGCQKTIAQAIRDGGGDYVLHVKENHPTLYDDICDRFLKSLTKGFAEKSPHYYRTEDDEHGRYDLREYYMIPADSALHDFAEWPDLKTLILVSRYRQVNGRKPTKVWHFYLSSLKASAKILGQYIRGHWSIENQLHWSLDIVFREDESRMRLGHSAANFGLLRRLALSLLKQDTSTRQSLPCKRHRAAINPTYALEILLGSFP